MAEPGYQVWRLSVGSGALVFTWILLVQEKSAFLQEHGWDLFVFLLSCCTWLLNDDQSYEDCLSEAITSCHFTIDVCGVYIQKVTCTRPSAPIERAYLNLETDLLNNRRLLRKDQPIEPTWSTHLVIDARAEFLIDLH